MGNLTPKQVQYSLPMPGTGDKPGETAIYRNPKTVDGLISTLPGAKTLKDLWLRNFENRPNEEFLGHRKPKGDGTLENTYTWETFAEVEEKAKNLGSGLLNLDMTNTI